MRFASLLSGGKDSCLAHHVAAQWGWEPVAGIVVRPKDPESHMFHVPNLDLAVAQVEALGLDLVEAEAAADTAREAECLEAAFREARVDTIISGAVASEYQRVRIERAAHRAGVKTHAPLWHKRPADVLDTLLAARFDVRFSAVAAEGLGKEWLGRRLDTGARDELLALEESLGVHPGGEGGEYESLVLDAPMFDRRIEVLRARHEWRRDAGAWVVEEWRWAARSS